MKVLKDYWWLLIIFTAVTLVFIINEGNLPVLASNTDEKPLDILSKVATKLIIVGALLDQFIAVFFSQEEKDKVQRVQSQNALSIVRAEESLVHKEILGQNLQGTSANIQNLTARLNNFNNTKRVAQDKITEIDARRSSYVRKIAFAAGLIIAMTGITVLRDFFEVGDSGLNYKILAYIDVVFTAAILSGGTSGINQLIQVIKDSWNRS